jgi:AAA+ ATPase superfamily predicted ATPase
MVILCGSLVHMMESQALSYNSPLYGRRTGQIKLRQIGFEEYNGFFEMLPYKNLIECYSVTGGAPKYIELFDGKADLFDEIKRLALKKEGLLFEEPIFLLQNEVSEVGSYFSIIKSIAAGNRRLGKICTDLEVKQTNMPKYLKTLIDLDIIEREVPVTERNPQKSKMGIYRIKDNFISFWFRFVYPDKARLELSDTSFVLQKIKADFVSSHVAYVYEAICQSEMWKLALQGRFSFNKLGRWWNNKEEIDIVGIDSSGDQIVFGECKYQNKPVDSDVFEALLKKKDQVMWKNHCRKELFILFSISGFTERLVKLSENRDDLVLFMEP